MSEYYMSDQGVLVMYSAAPGDGMWFEKGRRAVAEEKWWSAQVRILEGLHDHEYDPHEVANRLRGWGFVVDAKAIDERKEPS